MKSHLWWCSIAGAAAVVCMQVPKINAQSLETLLNEPAPAAQGQGAVADEPLSEELILTDELQQSTQPLSVPEVPADVEQQQVTPVVGEPPAPEVVVPLVEQPLVSESPRVEEAPAMPPAVAAPLPAQQPAPVTPKRVPAPRHKGHFLLGEEQIAGDILSSKEDKRLLIDGDIIYARMRKGETVDVGQVVWIYHIGPSIYDTTLRNASVNQATLIGKLRVLEVKGGILSGQIVRAYSPVLVGDVLVK